MDLEMLLVRVRELRKQTANVYELLSPEQASLRRGSVSALYSTLQLKLVNTGQPAAASFLQLVIDDVNDIN